MAAQVSDGDQLDFSKDKFAGTKVDVREKILNLSEISYEEVAENLNKLKSQLRKSPSGITKDGSLVFKYFS